MWLQDLVAKFGPVTERADNTTVLDFERPLAELDSRIREVRSSESFFFSFFFVVGACVESRGAFRKGALPTSRSRIGLAES